AYRFSQKPPEKGKVFLLFQPAEETGSGAKQILNDNNFKALNPDFVFALHNVPGYPKNQIICKSNTFTPAVVSLIYQFNAKSSHAAMPEKGHNPSYAMSDFIGFSQHQNTQKPGELVLVT